jgi:hypothetical protein
MRPWLPVCALLALGCSEAPPAVDAGTDGATALDAGADAAPLPDVPPVVDAARDAVAVGDTPRADVVDAGAEDAALPDVVLVFDVPRSPADAPDVAVAVPDVVDASPVDAGPQVYPLDPPPGGLEVRVLFGVVCPGGADVCGVRDRATGATCVRAGDRLSFSFRACNASRTCEDVTGVAPDYRSGAGASVAVVGGGATQGRDLEVAAGPAGVRQSFRVSFSAPSTTSAAGVTGVPGRTVSPARGDVWLLGCEVR